MKISSGRKPKAPKTTYVYLDYGETEVDSNYGDDEYEEQCAEVNETHHQLDLVEGLVKAAGQKFWYDGWGKIIVTNDTYENVLVPAMDAGKIDLPYNSFERDYNNSWTFDEDEE